MTLTALQSRLQALVAAAPLLTGRPVLIEDKGNLVSDLETALATVALAVVVAPESGQAKDGNPRGRAAWEETLEVAIHRGLMADEAAPSTVAVLDELRQLLHGAPIVADQSVRGTFRCLRHELRENGDGTYCRVLRVGLDHAI